MNMIRQNASVDYHVPIKIGEMSVRMFIDSGCDYTIISPAVYHESMGKIVEADTKLRAWGASDILDIKGMINT